MGVVSIIVEDAIVDLYCNIVWILVHRWCVKTFTYVCLTFVKYQTSDNKVIITILGRKITAGIISPSLVICE